MKTVAISGGFDPPHEGHLDLIEGALALGEKLIVILNSKEFLARKKGESFYSDDLTRYRLMRAITLGCLIDSNPKYKHIQDKVSVRFCTDQDDTVCETLMMLRPDVFANGGDRSSEKEIPEAEVCKKLGIGMVFGVGGDKKVDSSSKLQKENKC